MKTVSSIKELEKLVMQAVKKSMDEDHLGKEIKEDVQKHIRSDVYYVYHNKSYENTGEFHDSVISTEPEINGNEVSMSVEHDPELMNMKNPWYHQSVIDGEDVRESLPEIIHDGKTHDLWGHGDAAYLKPRPYMNNTYKELESNKKHVKKLVEFLKQQGLDAKEL